MNYLRSSCVATESRKHFWKYLGWLGYMITITAVWNGAILINIYLLFVFLFLELIIFFSFQFKEIPKGFWYPATFNIKCSWVNCDVEQVILRNSVTSEYCRNRRAKSLKDMLPLFYLAWFILQQLDQVNCTCLWIPPL